MSRSNRSPRTKTQVIKDRKKELLYKIQEEEIKEEIEEHRKRFNEKALVFPKTPDPPA